MFTAWHLQPRYDAEGWADLPLPIAPSVNHAFIGKLGNRSPAVQRWVKHCDGLLMCMRPRPRIAGEFEATIILDGDQFGHWDADNRLKVTMDWLESRGLISNDRLCRRLVVEWGDAPVGCVVKLRAWFAPPWRKPPSRPEELD